MKTIDLFCGCGGMSLGFHNAGFELIAAYDNWGPAVKVYSLNFQHPVYQADLSNCEAQNAIKNFGPELIIGGPPCQDFSTAGHMDETLGRAHLTIVYANIVALARPKFFVMENVPQARNSKAYQRAIEIFKQNGYGLSQMQLNACYCNVPQDRKRFFVIGEFNGKDGFLESYLEKGLSQKPLSIYDFLGNALNTEYYFRVPTNYSRRGVYSIYEPSVTIRGVDRPIPKGYKKHKDDPVDIGPQVRTLTVIERSYIQTFPQSYIFEGTKTDLNQMIGNAVPVNLANYVAEALKKYIEDKHK
ncbi:MAG: DNA cytosine methyltransferase [Allobaculum sp.]|nr:DNA cytosine methyltransferase [Allobaculum sp.]